MNTNNPNAISELQSGRQLAGCSGILIASLSMVFLFLISPHSWSASASMGGWSDLISQQKPVQSAAQPPVQSLTLSGKVVDKEGHPIVSAVVNLYEMDGQSMVDASELKLLRNLTTSADGVFEFELPQSGAILFAFKEGLAPACRSFWNPTQSVRDEVLPLTPPAILLGRVVDEADKPMTNAEVWITSGYFARLIEGESQYYPYVNALPRRPELCARTDADGKFRILSCPTNACVDLAVHKAGKVLRPQKRQYISPETMHGSPGQEEIKLILDPAGTIEGKVLIEENSQPLARARLVLESREPNAYRYNPVTPIYSGADGAFRISEIFPGAYQVRMAFDTNALPDWVAAGVPVTVEADQTARVEIKAVRGGVLEITVLGKSDRHPIPKAVVYVHHPSFHANSRSDMNGRTVFRLPAGQYQISASQMNAQPESVSASVETDKTNRIEIALGSVPKITGTVRDPSGLPVPYLELMIFPAYRAPQGPIRTDAEGRYEMTWDPRRYGGMNESTSLLARDEIRNLVAVQDIEEGTSKLDFQLEPGLLVSGEVKDKSGQPLTNATIQLFLWSGNSGSPLANKPFTVNSQGHFQISALPPDRRYSAFITAKGYGSDNRQIQQGEAENNRIDLSHVVLQVADQMIAGQVVDEEEKPAVKARVSLYGPGQPNDSTVTDRQGRFKFDQVCEGAAHLYANAQNAYGSVRSLAGDTNVILQLRSRESSSFIQRAASRRASLKDRPLPGLASCDLPQNGPPAGKPILLCLFDCEQRPSRRAIRSLAEQHESLKQKDLVVLALQSVVTSPDTFKEWKQENPTPFPVGQVKEQTDQTKWATQIESLPWFILANAQHQVIAEGFPLEELEANLKKVTQ